jgi:hypothetical protein
LTSVLNPVITARLSHNGRPGRFGPALRPMPESGLPPPDDRVPLFGTWRAIYAAVALSALAVMALVFLFSRWPF